MRYTFEARLRESCGGRGIKKKRTRGKTHFNKKKKTKRRTISMYIVNSEAGVPCLARISYIAVVL